MREQIFHTSARDPVPFIPASVDPDWYERAKGMELTQLEQAMERRRKEVLAQPIADTDDAVADQQETLAAIDAEEKRLHQERISFNQRLEEMRARGPMTFLIQIPTSVERERINARQIELGLVQVTAEMQRSTMIEELFSLDWSDGREPWTPADNEAVAEQHADFMDSCWLRQEAHDQAEQQWREQEVERIYDIMSGAPHRDAEPLPVKIISVRDQAKMQRLIDRVMNESPRMQAVMGRQLDYMRSYSMNLVRIHVVGVDFPTEIPIEREPRTRTLSPAAADALRQAVPDKAWMELIQHIDGLYKVTGPEEKNSDSPLGKPPLPSGSSESSGVSDGSDGSSTISSTSPAPSAASETTTAASSDSTSASAVTPAPEASATPTEAR